tara:strand:- start:1741 stop:2346 length:606 start_codon:yes stop_codon:yes gene_type:complete
MSSVKFLFPKTNNNKLLKIDEIGKYSISKPDDADSISQFISKNVLNVQNNLNNIIITDCTAGVGGNTISFCKYFNFVNSIEVDKIRFNYLKNNIEIFNLDNCKLINSDMLSDIFKIKQDILFIDPPWGGIDYCKKANLDLFINKIEITDVCNKILKCKICKLLVLKLPYNYNIINFDNLNKIYKHDHMTIRNKILLYTFYS